MKRFKFPNSKKVFAIRKSAICFKCKRRIIVHKSCPSFDIGNYLYNICA